MKMSDTMLYNTLDIWKEHLPVVLPDAHKYTRGYALFWGSPVLTGAVQLATLAARSIGTGVVGVACTKETHPIYATHMGLLTFTDFKNSPFSIFIEKARDPRVSALCIGPGLSPFDASFSVSQKESFLSLGKPLILDGGCLEASWLSLKRSAPLILTPHAGEWARLSGDSNNEEGYVQTWVEKNSVTVVLKGPKTTVFSSGQSPIQHSGASRYLSTAGTGDVLAGLITGLTAQGMPIHQSCAAAVWIHDRAAEQIGPYLLAEDLIQSIWDIRRSLSGASLSSNNP